MKHLGRWDGHVPSAQTSAFALAGAAPDAHEVGVGQRVFPALVPHQAPGAAAWPAARAAEGSGRRSQPSSWRRWVPYQGIVINRDSGMGQGGAKFLGAWRPVGARASHPQLVRRSRRYARRSPPTVRPTRRPAHRGPARTRGTPSAQAPVADRLGRRNGVLAVRESRHLRPLAAGRVAHPGRPAEELEHVLDDRHLRSAEALTPDAAVDADRHCSATVPVDVATVTTSSQRFAVSETAKT